MINFYAAIRRKKKYETYTSLTNLDRKRNIIRLLVLLLLAALTHTAGMIWFESLSFEDAFWLTMTTMTTVGYGDYSAATLGGRVVTILLMYIFGIFLLAQIAGEWIDYRMDRREKMRRGLWSWNMRDHIVIINTPDKDGSRYLRVLVEQIRNSASLDEHPILIFSSAYPDGLPDSLVSLGVVLRHGRPEGNMSLAEVDVESAAYVLILAVDTSDYRSDSLTLDILDQLKGFNVPAYVLAECVQDDNRQRLRDHGANAVIRPVRAYPELLVRAMAAPGTETILEDLFQHQGVHTQRYDMDINEQSWGQLAARIMLEGFGTPLGFIDENESIVTNPSSDRIVKGHAIFVLVNHDQIPATGLLQQCVNQVE